MAWWETTIMRLIASRQTENPIHILAVTHGAYLSALIRALLTRSIIVRPREMRLDAGYYNTSITIIDMFASGRGVLMRHCDINHLLAPTPSSPSGTLVPESAENADAEVLQDRWCFFLIIYDTTESLYVTNRTIAIPQASCIYTR